MYLWVMMTLQWKLSLPRRQVIVIVGQVVDLIVERKSLLPIYIDPPT